MVVRVVQQCEGTQCHWNYTLENDQVGKFCVSHNNKKIGQVINPKRNFKYWVEASVKTKYLSWILLDYKEVNQQL
jgi:hypothetical protein